jgi:hypothetical protein
MVEISNIKTYDFMESVIASRNAMRLTPPEYTEEEFKASLSRAIKLAKAQQGSGHDHWLCGIRVAFDIKYPAYFSPELQRYHFNDIVTSASKMHKLVQMDLDMCFNKYVPQVFVDEMKKLVARYNRIKDDKTGATFTLRSGEVIVADYPDALYYAFMECISACPQGIELFMRCTTNYLSLKTIYHQRKNHKLREDWIDGFIGGLIKQLPYYKELITGEYAYTNNE